MRGEVCQALLASASDDVLNTTCRLIGVWQPKSNREAFEEKLAGFLSSNPRPLRKAAAQGLAGLGSSDRLLAAAREADSRVSATAALVSLDPNAGITSAIHLLAEPLAEMDVEEIMAAILTQATAAKVFARELPAVKPVSYTHLTLPTKRIV